ncbi:MAG: Os1348 family NHLP clan protein [Anaerolineales bacterium]
MARDEIHKLIGRALTDRAFRENLLRSPMEAIRAYAFSVEERVLIASLRATSLEELSRKLAEHDMQGSGRDAERSPREAVRDS